MSDQRRRIRSTDPLGRVWSRQYDAAGQFTLRIRPDGSAATHSYPATGRLAKETQTIRLPELLQPVENQITYEYSSNASLWKRLSIKLCSLKERPKWSSTSLGRMMHFGRRLTRPSCAFWRCRRKGLHEWFKVEPRNRSRLGSGGRVHGGRRCRPFVGIGGRRWQCGRA